MAEEGVRVQDGGIVISCMCILYGKKLDRPHVRSELKKNCRKREHAWITLELTMIKSEKGCELSISVHIYINTRKCSCIIISVSEVHTYY